MWEFMTDRQRYCSRGLQLREFPIRMTTFSRFSSVIRVLREVKIALKIKNDCSTIHNFRELPVRMRVHSRPAKFIA